jgi:hypothetical protein
MTDHEHHDSRDDVEAAKDQAAFEGTPGAVETTGGAGPTNGDPTGGGQTGGGDAPPQTGVSHGAGTTSTTGSTTSATGPHGATTGMTGSVGHAGGPSGPTSGSGAGEWETAADQGSGVRTPGDPVHAADDAGAAPAQEEPARKIEPPE